MTDARAQMRADLALRDRARAAMMHNLEQVKSDWSGSSIKDRTVSSLRSSAGGMLDEATDLASAHKGALAAFVAAIAVWLARHPILSLLGLGRADDEEEDEDWDDRDEDDDRLPSGRRH